MNTKVKIILVSISSALLLSSYALALDSYNINASSSSDISEHFSCKSLTNNHTQTIFIPTRTPAEWTSVKNSSVASLVKGQCAPGDIDAITAWNNVTYSNYAGCGITTSTETITTSNYGPGTLEASVGVTGNCDTAYKSINGVQTTLLNAVPFIIHSGDTLSFAVSQTSTGCTVTIALNDYDSSANVANITLINSSGPACM